MHAPLQSISRLALSVDGTVEGYASLFGEVDQARDMVMPGALRETLKARGLRRYRCCSSTTHPSPSASGLNWRRFRGLRARGR